MTRRKLHVSHLLASGVLSEAKVVELQRVAQVLDPMRLLSQLEQLQHALWRHVIKLPEAPHPPRDEAPRFEVKQCAEGRVSEEGITAASPSLSKRRRKERQNPPRPHDWRTRPDPFEDMWEQTSAWLTAQPERTGVSIFQELQQLYPERFRDNPAAHLKARTRQFLFRYDSPMRQCAGSAWSLLIRWLPPTSDLNAKPYSPLSSNASLHAV
jgi:hypothetical protein